MTANNTEKKLMKIVRLVCAAMVLGLAGGALIKVKPAQAQGFYSIVDDYGVNSDDYDYMGMAAAELYENEDAKLGDETYWSNEASGAKGEVRLFSREGNCVVLEHVFVTRQAKGVQEVKTRRCKSDDGRWLLSVN